MKEASLRRVFMIPTLGCSEKGKYVQTLKKIRVSKEDRMNRWNTEDF